MHFCCKLANVAKYAFWALFFGLKTASLNFFGQISCSNSNLLLIARSFGGKSNASAMTDKFIKYNSYRNILKGYLYQLYY